MTETLYLAEITVYDPGIVGTRVLRYASGRGMATRTSETPSDTHYAPRLKQPALLTRDLFASGTTSGRGRVGYGDLVLLNNDGALDALIGYGFDGQPVTIRQGLVGAAYPSGFPVVFTGTMASALPGQQAVTIKLRDRQASLDVPIQLNKYAGSNALPAGLEGVATDLKDKPKPLTFGVALNVSAMCVNTAKLIYQVHDGAVADIPAVYDRGIPIFTGFPFTQQTTGFFGASDGPYASTYGNGLFVLAGDSGRIETSPDGITWTVRTSGFAGTQIRALCWNGALFVAVGASGKIGTSPDGITWTARSSASFGSGTIAAVCYTGALFVAVGADGTNGHIETSSDGITWTARANGFDASGISGVAASGSVVVVVGASGKVASSPTGITWTMGTLNAGTTTMNGVFFGNALFVALGNIGTVVTSPDGLAWTARRSGVPTASAFQCGAYGNGSYLVGGYNGASYTLLLQSATGIDWTVRNAGFAAGSILGTIAFGAGMFLCGDTANFSVVTSPAIGVYANATDLEDDTLAPAAGTYKMYLAGAYFRLGASPAGTITADVIEGATSADRTIAQLFKRVLLFAGLGAGDYNAGDLTTLDAADSAEVGLFIDRETTVSAVLDQLAGTCGASWAPDQTGVFRLKQLLAPTGSPVASFTANDLLAPLDRIASNDPGNGLPVYRTNVRWGKNYTVQTTDLAAGVTDARRVLVGLEWRTASATDLSVLAFHPLAPQTDDESCYSDASDALAEATRRQSLRGTRRDMFDLVVQLNATTRAIDLNDVVSFSHRRFGLSGGKLFRVLGLAPDAAKKRLTLRVWG